MIFSSDCEPCAAEEPASSSSSERLCGLASCPHGTECVHAKAEEAVPSVPPPLNGTKTHPLSAHALGELKDIAAHPVPRNAVNPGVANRLLREALVESFQDVSPFPTHKGKRIEFLRITKAGRAALAAAASNLRQ